MNRSKTDNFKKRISSIFYIVGPQRLATEKAGGVSDKQSTGKSSPPLSWNGKTNKQTPQPLNRQTNKQTDTTAELEQKKQTNKQTNATAAEQAAETDKQTKGQKRTKRQRDEYIVGWKAFSTVTVVESIIVKQMTPIVWASDKKYCAVCNLTPLRRITTIVVKIMIFII